MGQVTMIPQPDAGLIARLSAEEALWLFLDYDGTLAEFAPTPDIILPDQRLITLVNQLATIAQNRVTILSGRRLAHIQDLLPLTGIMMAGSYGLELQLADGRLVHRVAYDSIRPALEDVKGQWRVLLAARDGFYLEDKGWTLAIHAKDAGEKDAVHILEQARRLGQAAIDENAGLLRFQGGHRFLELAPVLADKRRTVDYLMANYPRPGALPLYLGDDDKDEVAFEAVQARGGLAVAVGDRLLDSVADYHLDSPQATRSWLARLIEAQTGGGDLAETSA
jgi:trehalose 6-phosphate phosphatase